MMKFGSFLLLAAAVSVAVVVVDAGKDLQVGDTVCVEGFPMDYECIKNGVLIDNSAIKTLVGPQEHSVHCLVDVPVCIESVFEILVKGGKDSVTPFVRGVRLDNETKNAVVTMAREIGICTTCQGGGTLERGLRVAMNATVALARDGDVPPTVMLVPDTLQVIAVDAEDHSVCPKMAYDEEKTNGDHTEENGDHTEPNGDGGDGATEENGETSAAAPVRKMILAGLSSLALAWMMIVA